MFFQIGNTIICREHVCSVEYMNGKPPENSALPPSPHYSRVVIRTVDGKEITAWDKHADEVWALFKDLALDISPV